MESTKIFRKSRSKTLLFAAVAASACFVASADVASASCIEEVVVSADTSVGAMAAPDGILRVTDGTATITTNGHEAVTLPPVAANGLALWLDATKNVFVDETAGGVVQWLDARETGVASLSEVESKETGGMFAYPRAKTLLSGAYAAVPPTLVSFDSLGSRSAVDFGEYQSGKWMYFATGDGTVHKRIPSCSFVAVIAFHNSNGFLLDDVYNLTDTGGKVFFHKEVASELYGSIAKKFADSESCFAFGETRLNGTCINPASKEFVRGEVFQLFSQVGPAVVNNGSDGTGSATDLYGRPFASVLFNDRNYANRQGGGIVAELLIYDHILSDIELRAAEAYLAAKWFGVSVAGRVSIADGAKVLVGEESTNTVAIADLAGFGALEKNCEGRLVITGGESLSDTEIAVRDGRVEFVGKRSLPIVAPVAGTSLSVTAGVLEASSIPGRKFSVSGGDVGIHPAMLSCNKVSVSGGTLSIIPPVSPVVPPDFNGNAVVAENLLVNGSFENTDPMSLGNTVVDGAWYRESGAHGSVQVSTYGSAWREDTSFKVDGEKLLALQVNGSNDAAASQNFTAPVDGLYRVTFWIARRESRWEAEGELKVRLLIDGEVFYANSNRSDSRGDRNVFRQFSAELPPLSAGRHKFTIQCPYASVSTDRALIVDDVQLVLVRPGEFVKVPNPGFESYEGATSSEANGWYAKLSGKTESFLGWTFDSVSQGESGITQVDSVWWNHILSHPSDSLDDYRKCYLQRDASISVDVMFPRDGRIRYSMRFSNRCNGNSSGVLDGNKRNVGHRLDISLDGTVFASAYPLSQKQYEFADEVSVTAGEKLLKIQSVRPDNQDYTSIIDDIRIEYVPDCEIVPNGESVNLSLDVPADGFYALTLPIAGRDPDIASTNVYNGYLYYPAVTTISVDGNLIGEVVTENCGFSSMVFRLPYLKEGIHTLTVVGVSAGSGALAVRRVRTPALAPLTMQSATSDLLENVSLSLSNGAKLDLQYKGKIRAKGRLSLDGNNVSGLVSATSHSAWISGPGSLEVIPVGLVMVFR